MATIETNNVTRTATVYVRHSPDCKHAAAGPQFRKCNCRKWLLLYDGTTKQQGKVSAKTRSWAEAEVKANEWIDKFDPLKVELAELKAEKQAKQIPIEDAVQSYLKDMAARNLSAGTQDRNRAVLVTKLNEWLAKQDGRRPKFICDMTAAHLVDWRSSWNYGSDLTAAICFDGVKTFFKFCHSQGWLEQNPAAGIKRTKITKGNRTATFTDEQYDAILAQAKEQRLHTFLELLRWSGMALVDAVLFDRKSVDDAGVLRYTRKKTGTLCTVKLPENVVALLRSVDGGAQPFVRKDVSLDSSVAEWRVDLQGLFEAAGIKQVMTEVGPRAPHPHMLRDTCAVWYLRHGMKLYGVAKILGHSNPTITAKHYLPFVKELETAHIEENEAVLAAAKPKVAGRVRAIR